MEIPKREPLANVVAEQLKKLIENGELVGVLPGEYVLLEKLQVSRKTVRSALQILTTSGHISAPSRGQRRRVLTPNSTRNVKQHNVAILTPTPLDTLNVSTKDLLRLVRLKLEKHDARCDFYHTDTTLKRDFRKKLGETLSSHKADLWIIFDANEAVIKEARSLDVPVLVCGSDYPLPENFHAVSYDLGPTVSHAFHLLLRHGHQRIFYPVTATRDIPAQVSQAFATHGITVTAKQIFPTYEGSKESLVNLLERECLGHKSLDKTPPTNASAIITDNSNITTVMTWLGKHQLRVPEEVAVLNIGDDPVLADIYPQIDHYTTGYKPLGKKIGSLALKLIKNPLLKPEKHTLLSEYIPGESIEQ